MSDHLVRTINELTEKLDAQMESAKKTKRAINSLCEIANLPIRYPDVDEASSVPSTIRGDLFYGQPLATCVRQILEMRKLANKGPATVNEIHDALVAGGFNFQTDDSDNAKRNLRISLTKNQVVFHKLPTGSWGLLAWYPNAKPPKPDAEEEPKTETKSAPAKDVQEPNGKDAGKTAEPVVKKGVQV